MPLVIQEVASHVLEMKRKDSVFRSCFIFRLSFTRFPIVLVFYAVHALINYPPLSRSHDCNINRTCKSRKGNVTRDDF